MTRGMGSLYQRLDNLVVPALGPAAEADVVALLESRAPDAAEASMLRQMLGFETYPRASLKSGRWKSAAAHGTAAGVAFHQEQRTELCRACRRWVYAREVHGTEQSCQAHYADGEALCDVCQAWFDDRHARANIAPGESCGTAAGFRRHRRLGERICEPCISADAQYAAKRKDRHESPGNKIDMEAGAREQRGGRGSVGAVTGQGLRSAAPSCNRLSRGR